MDPVSWGRFLTSFRKSIRMKSSLRSRHVASLLSLLAAAPSLLRGQSFTQQPESQSPATGSRVALHAEATGTDALSWQRNGVAIPGATGNTLVIREYAPATDSGVYRCVGTDADGGAFYSAEATLASAEGVAVGFAAKRYRDDRPNPWCPVCPHPPIILPLDSIAPGSVTELDTVCAQSVSLEFTEQSMAAMSNGATHEDIEVSFIRVSEGSGKIKTGLKDVLTSQVRAAAPGQPWSVFDTINPSLRSEKERATSGLKDTLKTQVRRAGPGQPWTITAQTSSESSDSKSIIVLRPDGSSITVADTHDVVVSCPSFPGAVSCDTSVSDEVSLRWTPLVPMVFTIDGVAHMSVSVVLKTKHDVAKNHIGNIRRTMAPRVGRKAPPTGVISPPLTLHRVTCSGGHAAGFQPGERRQAGLRAADLQRAHEEIRG
jgi:hypothetical protein